MLENIFSKKESNNLRTTVSKLQETMKQIRKKRSQNCVTLRTYTNIYQFFSIFFKC